MFQDRIFDAYAGPKSRFEIPGGDHDAIIDEDSNAGYVSTLSGLLEDRKIK
ncbi:MAG: hypothetical protein R3C03_05185 [Pirellulaceae bacterium]